MRQKWWGYSFNWVSHNTKLDFSSQLDLLHRRRTHALYKVLKLVIESPSRVWLEERFIRLALNRSDKNSSVLQVIVQSVRGGTKMNRFATDPHCALHSAEITKPITSTRDWKTISLNHKKISLRTHTLQLLLNRQKPELFLAKSVQAMTHTECQIIWVFFSAPVQ